MKSSIILDNEFSRKKIDRKSILSRIFKCLNIAEIDNIYVCNDNSIELLNKKFLPNEEIVIIKGNYFIMDIYELKNFIYQSKSDNLKFIENKNICYVKGNLFNSRLLNDIFTNKERNNEYKSKDLILEINDNKDLIKVSKVYYNKVCENFIKEGVIIHDINSTYISEEAVIGENVEIYPNNYILGNSVVCDNSVILPNCYVEDSVIGKGCSIGPFSHIKKDSFIGDNSVIGAYVEIKNSVLKEEVKAKHHAYLGDVKLGKKVNVGCGVIIANYDGKKKHVSIIGDNRFIGSNVTIISPVIVGDNVLIAAGSTIVKDICSNSLAIAREKQINKNGYYTEGGFQKKH